MKALLILVVLLTGCSTLVGRLPSVEHCQHVVYERHLNHVQIAADCEV